VVVVYGQSVVEVVVTTVCVDVVPFAGTECVLLVTGALVVPFVGKTINEVELLVIIGTLLVLL
jgi:hypothetical protein